ncbi:MAG TPA: hypothetical protein VIX86_05375 [Streptosporangiaceae bacterium]
MREAQLAAGQQAVAAGGAVGRRPRGPAMAIAALGLLGLVLIAACVLLTVLTRDLLASRYGAAPVLATTCGLLGALVARRQPRNPEGWLLLGLGVGIITTFDGGLYTVLDYRQHGGGLPLGAAAVFTQGVLRQIVVFVFPLVILLFPDGRLTRRWTWALWVYLVVIAAFSVGAMAAEAGTLASGPIRVDLTGAYSGSGGPTGVLAAITAVATIAGFGWILAVLLWPAFVARQALSWRRSAGDRRQQFKWLMGGAAVALAGLLLIAFGPPQTEKVGVPALALAALPASIGVAILKYHLYDIDRLISRTLSYALVTGLLAGVYVGVVTLATSVLPLTSTVGVAAGTLAAAALFSPLRRGVQRAVDRRFNRARYDAEATVTAFAARLKGAVDLDSVREDLAQAVSRALEPAHVSVWLSPAPAGPVAGGQRRADGSGVP